MVFTILQFDGFSIQRMKLALGSIPGKEVKRIRKKNSTKKEKEQINVIMSMKYSTMD